MTPAPSAPAPSTSTAARSAADSDTDLSKASPDELFESIVGVCTGTGSNKLNKAEVNAISGYLDTGRTC